MENQGTDFFAKYLQYSGGTEVPQFFNRWAAITGLSAWMGQDAWFQHGNRRIFPNLYVMLIGEPGTRKSTAIKSFTKLMRRAGFNAFSSEKTSKEKFLLDLANGEKDDRHDYLDRDLFGHGNDAETYTPIMIAADEFNDFFSADIYSFVSTLGVLWDWDSPTPYKVSVKHGDSPMIQNPSITILGGNTTTTLCKTFPPELLGQGFFSRVIFVHGSPNGKKIPFPEEKSSEEIEYILNEMGKLKESLKGRFDLAADAKDLLEHIYMKFKGLGDVRFSGYENRRFDHLIKLTQVHAFADCSSSIEVRHVIRANTILTQTEYYMPDAFGHFGMARNSEIVDRVMKVLSNVRKPMTFTDLMGHVHGDVGKLSELSEIVKHLHVVNKIQLVDGGGILPVKRVFEEYDSKALDWSYLTKEERTLA